MKKYYILLVAISILVLAGCVPNLVVQSAKIDFTAKTVDVTVMNNGNKDAGAHLTYIEINQVGVADSAKPQSQYSAKVDGIKAGSSWISGPIPFSSFSSPRGLDLFNLTAANLVVRVDAKNMVEESNENDNIYDVNLP
jgi:subtilase family serine protease